jgi:hypothetical protein
MNEYGLVWGNTEGKGYLSLVSKCAELPFDWLKSLIESKFFDVPSDMDRFLLFKLKIDLHLPKLWWIIEKDSARDLLYLLGKKMKPTKSSL